MALNSTEPHDKSFSLLLLSREIHLEISQFTLPSIAIPPIQISLPNGLNCDDFNYCDQLQKILSSSLISFRSFRWIGTLCSYFIVLIWHFQRKLFEVKKFKFITIKNKISPHILLLFLPCVFFVNLPFQAWSSSCRVKLRV